MKKKKHFFLNAQYLQGFPKKDACLPKIKNIPDLLSDDEEG